MLGVVVLRLSMRFFRSDPLSLASSGLILASNLGGLLRRDEIFQGAWGLRDCAASRPRRPRASRCGVLYKEGVLARKTATQSAIAAASTTRYRIMTTHMYLGFPRERERERESRLLNPPPGSTDPERFATVSIGIGDRVLFHPAPREPRHEWCEVRSEQSPSVATHTSLESHAHAPLQCVRDATHYNVQQ